ncbi:MAG TPA: hypothetical protein PLK63_17545, partial [Catalimonadaceae bacterium]|nr:hypothetical protein [Catalimonadaceae bacterium]
NENRTQTFCSDNGQHVVFDFTNFEIGDDGDSLFVYDGNSVNAPLLGAYLSFSLPEKITSEGTCLTFRFKSTASSQWNGWKAIISCSGADPASLTYPMASGVRATCGGVFADDGGLTLNYSSNQNRVQTFQSKAGQRIRFNFQQFALENNGDFLRIYDGPTVNSPLIGIFTGSLSPGIISSSGNSVTFWFTSNGSTSGNFAATIDCFDQALTAYNMSSGTTTTCSGMFYDNGGVSANYPLAENRTQTFCSGSTQKLQFTFNNLAFRMSTGDTLWAYDGNSTNSTLLGYYISNSYVETITSSGTCITFRFKSDFSSATVDQGWVSQITCTSVTPPALIYRMSSGLRVTCSGIFTDEGGLTGNYFDFPSYRTQTFQSPTNSRLQFEFTQFQTHSNSDVLYVYDGPNESYPLIGTYAVNNNPGTILSSGNSLTFSFYTNSSSNSTGWAANISCAGPALPIYIMSNNPVNACEGQWFDNGGLSNYPANTTVTQSFCSPTGQRMVFNFNFFGFLIGVNDSLLVYDGNSVNSPLKAVITGGMPIEPIVSSGSCITFRFKSTINSTQIGWSAKFSCSDNPSQPDVFPLSTGLRVACSGIFTDDGGLTGNYSDLVAKNLTFRSSTSGAKVQLSFSEFATQANSDVLYIYDGGTISSPLLGSYSGLNSPGIVTSTGSELTFRFVSSSSINAAGWKATLACVASVPLVGTLAFGPYCAGSALNIPFTSPNQTAGNVFTAQLSDANGLFSNPVNIGTVSGTSSGTIQATLPSGLTSSGNYRIRIIGSAPATTGNPSSPFSILSVPSQPSVISGSASVCAGTQKVSYSVAVVPNATNYVWSVPNGASVVSGQGTNAIQIDWGISSGTVSVVASNGCGTGTARNLAVTVNSATAPTGAIVSNAVNSQVCEGGSVTFSANPTAGSNPSLQWLVNGVEFAGATGTQLTLTNLISNVAVALRVTPTTGCFNPAVITTNT